MGIIIELLCELAVLNMDRIETATRNQNEWAHILFREASEYASYQGPGGAHTQAVSSY